MRMSVSSASACSPLKMPTGARDRSKSSLSWRGLSSCRLNSTRPQDKSRRCRQASSPSPIEGFRERSNCSPKVL